MYCPQCNAEYRRSFTRCSDCNVALVERSAEPDGAKGQEDADQALEAELLDADFPCEVIYQASNFFEANLIWRLLKTAGIHVPNENPLAGQAGRLDIAVPSSKVQFARDVLKEYLAQVQVNERINERGEAARAVPDESQTHSARSSITEAEEPVMARQHSGVGLAEDSEHVVSQGLICKVYRLEDYGGFWRRCWANLIDGFLELLSLLLKWPI